MSSVLVKCSGVTKTYKEGKLETQVLRGVDLQVASGDLLAIVGSSGSGKSTLLHVLGALDNLTSGSIEFNGQDIHRLSSKQQAKLRNSELGFVYQFHHLLGEFTALENVAMPLMIAGVKLTKAKERARVMLTRVGLEHRVQHRPSELSGGERQRVAIARALINEPSLLLMDEPTGNLDHHSAENIYNLICELNQSLDTAFIIVTHDLSLANKLGRTVHMCDGVLSTEATR